MTREEEVVEDAVGQMWSLQQKIIKDALPPVLLIMIFGHDDDGVFGILRRLCLPQGQYGPARHAIIEAEMTVHSGYGYLVSFEAWAAKYDTSDGEDEARERADITPPSECENRTSVLSYVYSSPSLTQVSQRELSGDDSSVPRSAGEPQMMPSENIHGQLLGISGSHSAPPGPLN